MVVSFSSPLPRLSRSAGCSKRVFHAFSCCGQRRMRQCRSLSLHEKKGWSWCLEPLASLIHTRCVQECTWASCWFLLSSIIACISSSQNAQLRALIRLCRYCTLQRILHLNLHSVESTPLKRSGVYIDPGTLGNIFLLKATGDNDGLVIWRSL